MSQGRLALQHIGSLLAASAFDLDVWNAKGAWELAEFVDWLSAPERDAIIFDLWAHGSVLWMNARALVRWRNSFLTPATLLRLFRK